MTKFEKTKVMEREKTAVEFLYEFVLLKLSNEQQMQFEGLFSQAKQMEKGQMNKMYDHAVLAILDGNGHGQTFDEYYEFKYGKDENKAENND